MGLPLLRPYPALLHYPDPESSQLYSSTSRTMGLSRPDLIDSALLRPGRLDKSLLCDIPSPSDREEVCFFVFYL